VLAAVPKFAEMGQFVLHPKTQEDPGQKLATGTEN
jgi:hypothetical protein